MMDHTFSGSRTVTAMFDNATEAERAVSRLQSAGVPASSIRHTPGSGASYSHRVDATETTYRDQHKGFFDTLGDFFFPEEDRYTYAEGLSRGSHMVTVTGFDPSMHDTIVDILDDEGSIDLDERESQWRQSGWAGYAESDYRREGDISGTGGMAGGTSGLSGMAAGLGHTIDSPTDRVGDMNTRGTIYDDGLQDRSVQMAAETGRRSQADLGSQQQGFASSGSMNQSGGMGGASDYGSSGMASTGMGMGSTGMGDRMGYRDEELNEDGTLKVVEERLNVGKRDVDMGRVRVRSYVREVPVEAEVDLRATRVYVERRPVDRAVSPGDIGMRDQVIEAREHSEQPVVAKEARVVEEIGLRQETEVHHEHIHDTVRKTEVEIEDERTGRTGMTGRTDRDRDGF